MKLLTPKKLIIFICLLFPLQCYADEIITGHYCFTYGDKESLKEAREITRTLAIRNAIESYKTFVESSTKVSNFQLSSDIIQILSSGYLNDVKVLQHTENDRLICDKISASVDQKQFEDALTREVKKRTTSVEEIVIDSNEYLKIIRVVERKCSAHERTLRLGVCKDWNVVAVVVKALKDIALGTHFKQYVFIDWLDSNGLPIDGEKKNADKDTLGICAGNNGSACHFSA